MELWEEGSDAADLLLGDKTHLEVGHWGHDVVGYISLSGFSIFSLFLSSMM